MQMSPFSFVGRAIALLFAVTLLWVSPATAGDRIVSDVKVTPKGRLSNKEIRALSLATARLLRHARQARKDIKDKNGADARRQVEKALLLARIIENAAPEYEIDAKFKSGNLAYTDKETSRQPMVPIFTELDEFVDVLGGPVKRDKTTAHKDRTGALPKVTEGMETTDVFFDVANAKYLLERASDALEKEELHRADNLLAAVRDDLITVYAEEDLPIARARWHLMEAARMVGQKSYRRAKEFLQSAATDLQSFKYQVSGPLATQAGSAAEKARALAAGIEKQGETGKEKILSLWENLAGL